MPKRSKKPPVMIRLATPQTMPVMRFEVSIRINLNDMDMLNPEQVRAVMRGIGKLVAVAGQ